ncbi:MAG: hypothetical protein WCA44_11880 [Acidobacteriaceae bacterium]
MRRPAGVIIAAVLLGIVALFGILGEALALGVAIFSHSPVIPKIPGVRAVMISSTAVELAFFVFCAWTVVGLFRMRPWSRIAAIVIASLFAFFSACMGVGVLLVRQYASMLPPGPASASVNTGITVMGACCFLYSAISIWWIVYFNFASVRGAFAGTPAVTAAAGPDGTTAIIAAQPASGTPGWRIVIIVWACMMLLGSVYLVAVVWTGIPMFFFGAILTGAAAKAGYIVMCAVEIYLGIGLLRKWKAAWYVALLFQVYVIAYSAELLLPGVRARFLGFMQVMMERSSGGLVYPPSFTNSIVFFSFGFGAILAVVLIWALIARKEDYLHA